MEMPVKSLSTVKRALTVLEMIGRQQPVSASEIATALDIDRSALQRVLVTLAEADWARARPDQRWELAPSAFVALGSDYVSFLRQRIKPALERLRDETGETAFLAVSRGDHVVVTDVAESVDPIRIAPPQGQIIDADLSAALLAINAFLPPPRLQALREASEDVDRLARELQATRERGWSAHDGAVHDGITSIGAPLLDGDGVPVGAVLVCGPSLRLAQSSHERVGALLRRTVEEFAR